MVPKAFCRSCWFEGLFVDRGQPDQSWLVTRIRYGAAPPDFDEKETCSFEFFLHRNEHYFSTNYWCVHCSVSAVLAKETLENVRRRMDESRVFSNNFSAPTTFSLYRNTSPYTSSWNAKDMGSPILRARMALQQAKSLIEVDYRHLASSHLCVSSSSDSCETAAGYSH